VLPEFGRCGIGRALVQKVLNWTKENNYPSVTLFTYVDIPWNAPFYCKMGFVEFSSQKFGAELKQIQQKEKELGLYKKKRVCMIKVFK